MLNGVRKAMTSLKNSKALSEDQKNVELPNKHSASFPYGKRKKDEKDRPYPKNATRFHTKGCNEMNSTRI
jgi:hypothetical protein